MLPVGTSLKIARPSRLLALVAFLAFVLGLLPPWAWPVVGGVPRAVAADQQMRWTWNVTGSAALDEIRGGIRYTSSRKIMITGSALVHRDANGEIIAEPFGLTVADRSEGTTAEGGFCASGTGVVRAKLRHEIIDGLRYNGYRDQYLVFPEHLEPLRDGNGGTYVADLFPALFSNGELTREFTYRSTTEYSSDCGATTNFATDSELANYTAMFTRTSTRPLLPNADNSVYTRQDTFVTEMQDIHGFFPPMTVSVYVTATPTGSPDPTPAPSPTPTPSSDPGTPPGGGCVGVRTLRVATTGPGSATPDSGDRPACEVVSLRATPAAGHYLVGWTVDGTPAGATNPLQLSMAASHDVVATFAPRPAFADVSAADPAAEAIAQLAARGIVNGCDGAASPPRFCPADLTLRHQLAALIVRAMPGWSAEDYPNTFTDPTPDAELWRRVATLQHYGVVGGYRDCAAQGLASPCYGPTDPVLRAQAISFVTRAMVAQGYWQQQPTDPTLYGGALVGTGHEGDASTYWHYTRARGGVPDYPAGGSFPTGEAAPRAWFARLLWTAIQGSPAAP